MSINDNGAPPGGWKPSGSSLATRGAPAGPPPPAAVRPPSTPRERKPALVALGLLLVLAGALASVYLQQRAGDRVGVVQVVKRVPQGQSFPAGSVAEVMVAVDPGISYVTWAQFQSGALSHYTAETDLMPGTLLVGQMLTAAAALPADQEVVGVSLKDGQYPAGIQAGDTVSVYFVSGKNDQDRTAQQYLADGFTATPIVSQVLVYDVGEPGSSGSLDVSLVLGRQYASAVLQAASGGNAVLAFDKHTR